MRLFLCKKREINIRSDGKSGKELKWDGNTLLSLPSLEMEVDIYEKGRK